MDQATLLSIIGFLITFLLAVLIWIGKGVIKKIEDLPGEVANMVKEMYERLNAHSERITIMEVRCDMTHGKVEERRKDDRRGMTGAERVQ